jgi:small multidrug resistance family-3 protein
MVIATSVVLFLVAGLFEIAGGYLVWQWWRNGEPWWLDLLGAIILILYGIVPTYQPANFGPSVCSLWGMVYRVVDSLGMGHR